MTAIGNSEMYRPIRSPLLMMSAAILPLCLAGAGIAQEMGDADALHAQIDALAVEVEPQVITWRRDFHQHPELPNRENRTAARVAALLKEWKFDEVRTGVAHTGVVGLLKGAKPGPVVALRADMDAVVGTEKTDAPFASRATVVRDGKTVGIAHLLGHDMHTATLLGVAQVLAQMRGRLPGSVKFIFQPAEGLSLVPPGEEGGAELMIKQGVLEDPRPEAIFALHVGARPAGTVTYSNGAAFASNSRLHIGLKSTPAPVMAPWLGQDPVPVMAQMILALQTIPSRQMDVTRPSGVITIAKISAGPAFNQLPAVLEMEGTVRLLDNTVMQEVSDRIRRVVVKTAESAGMTAEVKLTMTSPVLHNDVNLISRMLPSLTRVASAIAVTPPVTGGENFAYFSSEIPALYFVLGVNKAAAMAPGEMDLLMPAEIDETGMTVGVKALASMAVDYLLKPPKRSERVHANQSGDHVIAFSLPD